MNTASSVYDNPILSTARETASSTAKAAGTAASEAMTLPDQLRSALTKKFGEDNPVVQQRQSAFENYLNTTTQAPLDVTSTTVGGNAPVIFNPLQQANLIQQKRSAALAPLSSLNDLFGLETGGLENVIGATSRANQAQVAGLNTAAQLSRQNYEDILNELSKKAEEAYRLGGSPLVAHQTNILNQVGTAAKAGKTLDEVMQMFGTQSDVTPDDILRIYNTNSPYGPAKETSQELQNKYRIKPLETTEIRNRQAALAPAMSAVTSLDNEDFSKAGTTRAQKVLGMINSPLGIGKMFIGKEDQDLVALNQKLALLKQNVVRYLQGARMSDQDIAVASNYIPSIQDTPETIKTNLQGLKDFMNNLGQTGGAMGNTNTTTTNLNSSDLNNIYNTVYGSK